MQSHGCEHGLWRGGYTLADRAGDWGVFEPTSFGLRASCRQVKATYVVLLNLFRDQLDRCGEIDRVQDAIISGLEHSPESTLIYNGR